ncbi:MAG: SprB repeat-containing protein [Saprospiraceae bacterium]
MAVPPGYTYLWSNGFAAQDLSGLTIGTYTVTVTDANGCTAVSSATVGQPPLLTASVSVSNVQCFGGSDGSIDLTVNGGTPGYSYQWSNGFTGQDPSGLPIGTYTVTVTDSHGCTVVTSGTITQPPLLVLSHEKEDVSCFGGSDGNINLTVSGGTPAYTYQWSNGFTGQDPMNVPAGTYTVTVTDSHGCTAIETVIIGQPTDLSLSVQVNDAVCFGSADGSIDLSVSGGTPGYTYQWSNGATSQDISGLSTGNYTVTVTDSHGCTKVISGFVNQPPLMTLSTSVVPVSSCGLSDGSIIVDVTNGVPGFSYEWTGGGQSGNGFSASEPFSIDNLGFGNYSITVTNADGCTAVTTALVTQPSSMYVTSYTLPTNTCNSSDGTIVIEVFGGDPNYAYTWVDQDNNMGQGSNIPNNPFEINNLPAGSYSVTVTSSNGCIGTTFAVVESPSQIALSSSNTLTCHGDADGTITIDVTGGSPGLWL